MPNQKDDTCPACGEGGFRPQGAVHACANCKAIGWIAEPLFVSRQKAQRCYRCESDTLTKVFETAKISIFHCATCKSTVIET